jgi:acyl-CoA synthetase (AMP-forming)/AMP-acid ligase II
MAIPGADEAMSALLDAGRARDPALVRPDDGSAVRYSDLAAQVETLAGRLAGTGVRRGDRVALALSNSTDFVQLVLAINLLGAAAAPLNPAYTAEEFRFYLGDIEPRLLLLPSNLGPADEAAATVETRIGRVVEVSDGPMQIEIEGKRVDPAHPREFGDAKDVALVLHTSGTTSRPKQVPLLQRNLMASTRAIASHYRLDADDISFCAMPLFHVHGFVASALAALAGGGSIVVPRRFTPHRFWPQAREQGVTWLSAGPTHHQMIVDRFDGCGPLGALRFTRSCSSALPPALLARAEEIYGVPMLEAYGMTEASHQMAANPLPPAPRYAGSVGIPTGTEIALIDSERRFLAPGTSGEVVIRGPGVTLGYAHNPEANAEAFFDGWFRTGDLGSLRDGYLWLEGRLKEMIIRGGENISPAELEGVLLSHPAVNEAVCFGVADEKYGELPAVAVTLSSEVDVKTLATWCRERVTAVKVPSRIYILDAIPRTATGKVQRRRMAQFLEGVLPAK